MIVITGTIGVAADSLGAALSAIATLEARTREEDGCLEYGFWQSPNEPTLLAVVERWRDADSLDAHMASAHMAEFLTTVGPMVTSSALDRHDVSATTKLM
ncbi:MAG: putative quinol monooxygenase [Microthrixaceae bacterium]